MIFLYLGRLAKVKGIPLLLQSLVEFHKTIPQAKLLIVGDGEEKVRIQEMCISLGIEKSVIFCGLLAPEEVALHVCAADVCVVASETEGFSNAMIEQIACGKPIVSTAVSGAKELICEGENGYIVHSRDPKEYAQKMINATHLFKAEEISRSIAVNNYSDKLLWETVQNQWPAIKISR
ncbi:MAG: glycosyltransferase family 4 protein [Bacteroidales bacterium]|nr:glycosyltransferase family 4 protein [Bacteroidales bacterium]